MVETSKIKKPGRRTDKGEPPPRQTVASTPNNLDKPPSSETVPLQFKVPAEIRREVKSYAIAHDYKDQSTLFLDIWTLWRQHNP